VATIGSAFGGIPQTLPSFSIPSFPVSDVLKLIGPAFTIALLGAIESLLSAVVADGMAGTKHDSNQELIGQGFANIASPLFGGFASTGAIARTATNFRNGANSPLAGLVHAATLIAIILALAPLAAYIPLCALAAILFVVAYNMSEMHRFVHLMRTAPGPDVGVLVVTFLLTVFADLVIAVNVGVILATLMFMRRMALAVQVQEESGEDIANGTGDAARALPSGTVVYSIDGPFFFGAAEKLERTLENIQSHVDTVVLRMGRVPFVDSSGIHALEELANECLRFNTRLVFCELRANVTQKLERAGLIEKIGSHNVFSSLDEFLTRARDTK
jgi:SulP family sulfate permease